jgi:phage baseplate assembly protein gpV
MEGLLNIIRREAEITGQSAARTRIGLVSSYDPTTYMVKVRLQPEDQETGWLRIMGSGAASGVGVFAPPPIGAQVVVHFQEGSGGSGIVGGTLHSDAQPPAAVPAGEVHIVTASGGVIRINAHGRINITAPVGVTLDSPDVATTENLRAGNGATGAFTAASGQTVTVQDGIVTNIF